MKIEVDPKVDYAFKYIFGKEKNRDILIHLLNAVLARYLGRPLTAIEILNPFSSLDALDDKLSILDIKARDDLGRLYNIEMQMLAPAAVTKRFLYYWSRVYQEQLAAGEDYTLLKPTISVIFLNQVLFKETIDHHLHFEILNRQHGIRFHDDLQIHTIELPKLKLTAEQLSDPLDIWCWFLKNATTIDTEHLPERLNLPTIHRAIEELSMLNQNDLERERYEARMKKQRDDAFFPKAIRADILAEGRAEGRSMGQLIGRIQAYQESLKRQATPEAELETKSIDELQQLADQLRDELTRPK